jgi:NOL1/NOP2/fmu family ribosome biogenesis protein/23S rRNA U2552 (ribose-2'-O)-methylase RlmE/FtsJ
LRQIITEKPLKVLDLCAAPGGKSTDALACLPEGSLLVSNEIDGVRSQALLENIKKWGYENVVVTQSSAQDFGRMKNFFDVIILDAPCSGEGMFRKDDDAIERWSPSLVRQCSELQHNLIDDLISALKPSGYIIYSTCTFAPEEDEMVINYLQELGLTSVAMPVPAEWQITETEATDAVCYRFYPHKTKGEGFFAACLQKAEHGGSNFKAKKNHSLPKISQAERQQVMPFLKENNHLALLKQDKDVIAFPQDLLPDLEALQSKVKVLYYGVLLGQLTPKELIPAHELALSHIISDKLPFVALDKADAIRFLQKNPIENANITQKGWQLVRYENANLGWIKVLDNRINNHYPQHFKIRKQGESK